MARPSSRVLELTALAAGVYALTLGLLTFYVAFAPRGQGEWVSELVDVEDLLFTIPLAAVFALVAATVALVRRRGGRGERKRLVATMVLAIIGLLGFAAVLAMVLAAASVLGEL